MTRDEAIEKDLIAGRIIRVVANTGVSDAALRAISAARIDSYVAIGLLKLDEPKTAWDKFCDEAQRQPNGWSSPDDPSSILAEAREILDRAGLKIVEAAK